ncbi:crotonase/enoyl-CoA hydratase family protein [Porticoccaceae bacterium]|nr:crotonase/enoyl-CoA hydratase family protein [Porticoccaceae bacterium]
MRIDEFSDLKSFEVTIDDHQIAEIRLNRPTAINAMNTDFWRELPAIISTLDNLGSVRVVILSASGKHFTAGMDLQVFEGMTTEDNIEPARAAEKQRRWIMALQDVFSALETARMPVISAIQGACIGGGVDMICATDIRLCTSNAFFNIKETELGITADVGTLQRILHVMPSGIARELAYTSRNFAADEALKCGFVNNIYDSQEEMLNAAHQLARSMAKHSPMAVNGVKEMLNYSRDHSVADSLNHMATWQGGMLQNQDILEAMTAAKEKRVPSFDDLLPLTAAEGN